MLKEIQDYSKYIGCRCYPKNNAFSISRIFLKDHVVTAEMIWGDQRWEIPFKDILIENI